MIDEGAMLHRYIEWLRLPRNPQNNIRQTISARLPLPLCGFFVYRNILHPIMELEYDDKTSDLVMSFRYICSEIKLTKVKNGLSLIENDQKFTGIASILNHLKSKYGTEYITNNTQSKLNTIKNKSAKHLLVGVDTEKTFEHKNLKFTQVYLYTRIYKAIKEHNYYSKDEMSFFKRLESKIEEKVVIKKIDFFDFLDIRVGKIIEIEEHPDADSLYIETVLIDQDKTLKIVSGLRKFAEKSDLLNKKFLFLVNMKKSKLRGVESEGMILCVKHEDGIEVIEAPNDVKEGTRLVMKGFETNGCDVVDYKHCLLDAKSEFFRSIMDSLKITNSFMTFAESKLQIDDKSVQTKTQNGNVS